MTTHRDHERKRRAFLRDPKLVLLDIPTLAAAPTPRTITHREIATAIKSAQAEYRALPRVAARRSAPRTTE